MILSPFPDGFWNRTSIKAIGPAVHYAGPFPAGDPAMFAIVQGSPWLAYVYVIVSDLDEVLYVGKTVNPVGRFSKHRHQKTWWPTQGRLVLLGVDGLDRGDAEAAAFYVEKLAIRVLRPLYNIAGVMA